MSENTQPPEAASGDGSQLGASQSTEGDPAVAPESASDGAFHATPVWGRFYALLLGPALLAAAVLAVFTIVSILSADEAEPRELVEALESGGQHRRWQAAFALTKYLQPSVRQRDAVLLRESDADYRQRLDQVTLLIPELLGVWNRSADRQPEIKRFLALAFSYLGDRRLLPALTGSLGDEDTELVHYSLAAIGTTAEIAARKGADIADPALAAAVVAAVVAASQRKESDVRATATYVLALLGTETAKQRLHAALKDPAPAVVWNAAFGLARHGDGAGEEVIAEILDRGPLYQAAGPDAARQRDLFLNAVRSAGKVASSSLRTKLSLIAQGDEELAAREEAQKQLEQVQPRSDEG